MIEWLNPWAWAGLGALAIPIAVHLISRRPPREVPFPSLRFLDASTIRPSRRSVLSDRWLLAVRLLLLAAAVATLAQPVLVNTAQTERAEQDNQSTGSERATAVVLERTASGPDLVADDLPRAGYPAEWHGDSLVLATSAWTLRPTIARAIAWLRTQPSPRALIVRSRFPLSALDSTDLAALPRDVRVSLVRETSTAPAGPSPATGAESAMLTAVASRDTVQWITALGAAHTTRVAAAVYELGGAVVLVRPAADTAMDNTGHALLIGAAGFPPAPRSPSRPTTSLAERQAALDRLMMVAGDGTVRHLARLAPADSLPNATSHRALTLQVDAVGRAAVQGLIQDGKPMVRTALPERPALATAILLALSDNSAIRARREHNGQDPATRDELTLQQWQRLPSAPPIGIGDGGHQDSAPSGARWGWMLVLGLAGVELLLRRRS